MFLVKNDKSSLLHATKKFEQQFMMMLTVVRGVATRRNQRPTTSFGRYARLCLGELNFPVSTHASKIYNVGTGTVISWFSKHIPDFAAHSKNLLDACVSLISINCTETVLNSMEKTTEYLCVRSRTLVYVTLTHTNILII